MLFEKLGVDNQLLMGKLTKNKSGFNGDAPKVLKVKVIIKLQRKNIKEVQEDTENLGTVHMCVKITMSKKSWGKW